MNNKPSIKSIKIFVVFWNKLCPIDKWWRDKHNVIFNSLSHREVSFIDMYIEYCEDLFFYEEKNKRVKEKGLEYIPGSGNFMKEVKLTKEELDQIFEEIDLDKID